MLRRTARLLVLLLAAVAVSATHTVAGSSRHAPPRKVLRAVRHAGEGADLLAAARAASAPAVAAKPVHLATVVRLASNTRGTNRAGALAAGGVQLDAIAGRVAAVTAGTKQPGSKARKAAKRAARVAAASLQQDAEAYSDDDAVAAEEEAAVEEQLGQMLTGINLRVAAAEAVVAGYSDDGAQLSDEEQDAEFAALMVDILSRVAAVQDVMENAGLAGPSADEERTALERDDADLSAQEDARKSVFAQHPAASKAAKRQAQEARAVAEQEVEEEEEHGVDADIVEALPEQEQEQEEAGDAAAIADGEDEAGDAALDGLAVDAADDQEVEEAAREVAISAKLTLLSHLLAGLSVAAAQR